MARDNETVENIEGELEAYALGILEPDEMAAMEAHVATCARCQAELVSLRHAVYAFALAIDAADVSLPEGHAERFARKLAAESPRPAPVLAPAEPAVPRRVQPAPLQAEPRRGWWQRLPALGWAAAGVLALFLVVTGLWAANLQGQVDAAQAAQVRLQQQLAQVQTDRDHLAQERTAALAILGAGDVVAKPLTGTDSQPNATGNLWIDPASNRAVLVMRNLPPLPANQTYEFWLIADAPVPAGIFQTAADGSNWLVVSPQQALSTFKVAAVTAEPGQGGTAPKGPIVLQGGL